MFGKSRYTYLPVSARFMLRFLFGFYEEHDNDFIFLVFNST